jgi:subtilisin family serine protease
MIFATRIFLATVLSLAAAPAFAATYDSQWALENKGQSVCDFRGKNCISGTSGVDIKYAQASAQIFDCSAITVAVLDTGADLRHPDLQSNLLPGKNFVDGVNTDDPTDDNLHGTHVSGIIAGSGTRASGVVGVCHKARILPVKVASAQGSLTDADILAGVDFAVKQGARVVNASFGGGPSSDVLKAALQKASNVLFVIAAGNGDMAGRGFDIDQQPVYPASYGLPNIIAVAATDNQDRLGGFSNFGANTVHLAAPGVHIVSALPTSKTQEMDQYNIPTGSGPLDGTSMATPYVTGAVALVWSANPSLSADQVKSRLLASVDPVPGLVGKVQSGGRLNLAKLVNQ